MSWRSWTTVGIHALPNMVRTDEIGVINGDLTIHTTWSENLAHVTVQHTGSTDWYTVAGSPVPCPSEEAGKSFHEAVVEAIYEAGNVPISPWRSSSAHKDSARCAGP